MIKLTKQYILNIYARCRYSLRIQYPQIWIQLQRLKNGQIYHPVPENTRKQLLRKYNTNITRRAKLYSRSITYNNIFLTSASLSDFCFNSPGSHRLHVVNAGALTFQKAKKRNRQQLHKINTDAKSDDMSSEDIYEPYKKLRKRVRRVLA